MTEASPEPDRKVSTLRAALRVARAEEAERSQAMGALHGLELARLELLREEIEPVLAQVPDGIEMFDAGLMPGAHPRLFIDMIAFIEMAHDKRHYRFVQSKRHGRTVLAESDRPDVITDAVAAYIARRLVERERALASDSDDRPPAARSVPPETAVEAEWSPERLRRPGLARRILWGMIDSMGIAALCLLAWVVWRIAVMRWG